MAIDTSHIDIARMSLEKTTAALEALRQAEIAVCQTVGHAVNEAQIEIGDIWAEGEVEDIIEASRHAAIMGFREDYQEPFDRMIEVYRLVQAHHGQWFMFVDSCQGKQMKESSGHEIIRYGALGVLAEHDLRIIMDKGNVPRRGHVRLPDEGLEHMSEKHHWSFQFEGNQYLRLKQEGSGQCEALGSGQCEAPTWASTYLVPTAKVGSMHVYFSADEPHNWAAKHTPACELYIGDAAVNLAMTPVLRREGWDELPKDLKQVSEALQTIYHIPRGRGE